MKLSGLYKFLSFEKPQKIGRLHLLTTTFWLVAPILLIALLKNVENITTNSSELFRSLFLGRTALELKTLYPNYPLDLRPHQLFAPLEASLGCIITYAMYLLEKHVGLAPYSLIDWLRLLALWGGSLAITRLSREVTNHRSSVKAFNLIGQCIFILLAYRICPVSPAASQFLLLPWILVFITKSDNLSRIWIIALSSLWANLHYSATLLPIIALGSGLHFLCARALRLTRPSKTFIQNLALATLAQCIHPRGGKQIWDTFQIYTSPLLESYPDLATLLGVGSPYFRSYPEIAAALPIFVWACYLLTAPLVVEWILLSLIGILLLLSSTVLPSLGILACGVVCSAIGSTNRTGANDCQIGDDAHNCSFTKPCFTYIALLLGFPSLLAISLSANHQAVFQAFPVTEERTNLTFVHLPLSAEALFDGTKIFFLNSPSTMLEEGPEYITGSAYGDYRALVRLEDNWEAVIKHWNIRDAIVYTTASLGAVLQQKLGWIEIDRGPLLEQRDRGQTTSIQAVRLQARTNSCCEPH